jgi:hypothetical protein
MAIILTLIVILGLAVGSIAIQGTAGMLAVQGVKNQRQDVYGAEGAIDAAINYIRGDLARGRWDDTSCPSDAANPNFFTAPSDSGTVTVSCKSLAPGGIEIEGVNYPENAVRTLSGIAGYPVVNNDCPGDPGICVGGDNGGRMIVDGSVKSNAARSTDFSITTRNGSRLNAKKNSIRATGLCTPVAGFEEASPLACATGTEYPDPSGTDATTDVTTGAWASEMLTVPPVAPQPSCDTTSKVATMEPGSYFDRDQMLLGFSKVVGSSRISCPIVWMKPGNYYFDLDDATDIDPWRIGYDDARAKGLYSNNFSGTDIPGSVVIGGTPSGWNPSATSSQVSAARNAVGDPGACDKTSGTGVQVMMANYSAFDVKDQGMLELCPNPFSSKQQIALYGRKTDQPGSPTTAVFKPSSAGSATPSSFGTPFDNVFQIDGSVVSGTQNGSNRTNTVTLSGYANSAASPEQSFTGATLRVAHREVTNPSNRSVTIRATVTASDGDSCNTTSAFTKQTTLTEQTWSIPTSCIDSLSDLDGARLRWDVSVGSGGGGSWLTTELDGAEFTADYVSGGLQAKTPGSKIVWMYGDYANQRPEIYIWGTVYAPTSRIELGLAGVSSTVARFGRGVVLAALLVKDLEVEHSYAMFSNASGVPHYQDRYLELIAYVGGKPYLRVVVKFDDSDPSTPGKVVTIERWNAVA